MPTAAHSLHEQKIDMSIGLHVRSARVKADLSMGQLGDMIGVSHQQCQKYESGKNRISAAKLALIACALDRPIEWFFEDTLVIARNAIVPRRRGVAS
jgi:transcriptional regulator with XRE-family HTH domain